MLRVAACAVAAAVTNVQAMAQHYQISSISMQDLDSDAYGLNNAGQVVGYSRGYGGGGPDLAVLWEDGQLHVLGNASAVDINHLGHAVGRNSEFLAAMWEDGQQISLGTLPGYAKSQAAAINDLDQIVGEATEGSFGRTTAFLWEDGIFTDLGALGGADSIALDINEHSQVVGQADTAGGFEHAYIWADGMMTDLGVLEDHLTSMAVSINKHGVMVGYSADNSTTAPCIWDQKEIAELPRLGGDAWTRPAAINDVGVIVGTASSNELGERAVMWRDGQVIDLNQYVLGTGWVLQSANDINNRGWIVGLGRREGRREGYVLIPDPSLKVGSLISGQPVDVQITGGTPVAPVFLAYGTSGFGLTYIPPLGVELQLHRPRLAARGRTDEQGDIMWTLNVPPGTSGARVLFQGAQQGKTTGVVTRTIE